VLIMAGEMERTMGEPVNRRSLWAEQVRERSVPVELTTQLRKAVEELQSVDIRDDEETLVRPYRTPVTPEVLSRQAAR
jgi:hypothetical protein